VVAPILSEPRLRWTLIVSTVVTATLYFVWLKRQGRERRAWLPFLAPRSVFLHPSAVLDYKFFVLNQLLMAHAKFGGWVVTAVGLLSLADLSTAALTYVLGPVGAAAEPSVIAVLAFTLVTLLAWDFGKYVAHYLTHKVPLLWEFHKVHHAAEVLTPVSAFRAHPFDIMIDFFFRLVCTAVVAGVFAYWYPSGIVELQILGFNAVAFVVYYWIAHLQHSHIPLGYGRLSKVLVSPVMHQVHHSCETRHWDRNFGFVFSIWDLVFRTIYVPQPDEPFRLGLPPGKGAGNYGTVSALFLRPFVGGWRILAGRDPNA
jgi:sterol desaturase/sphingolipid hydroxylase (fatty acid hydroxylase superfamily)